MENFQLRLKEERSKLNLTQQELAHFLGMTQQAYQKIESGKASDIKISTLVHICETLNLSADDLLGINKPKRAISARDLAILRTRGKHPESAALKVAKAKPGAGLRKRKYEIKD